MISNFGKLRNDAKACGWERSSKLVLNTIKINSSDCFAILDSDAKVRHRCLFSYLYSSVISFFSEILSNALRCLWLKRSLRNQDDGGDKNVTNLHILRALHEGQEHDSFVYISESVLFCNCVDDEWTRQSFSLFPFLIFISKRVGPF